MQIGDLDSAKAFFERNDSKIFGLGITGFSRISPFYLAGEYRLFCGKSTPDLSILRGLGYIRSMEEEVGVLRKEITSLDILSYGPFWDEIRKGRGKYLYVYQSYKRLEDITEAQGIRILANRAWLREVLSSKLSFMGMLEELGIPSLPWVLVPRATFLELRPKEAFGIFGGPFVAQVTEITRGGGRGVFFVREERDLLRAKGSLQGGFIHGVKVGHLLLRPLVEGLSLSALGCVTKRGVVSGPPQLQLIDLYGETHLGERGIFCGHSWDKANDPVGYEMAKMVKKVGSLLKNKGYRGIFGVDFVAGKEGVFPLELNPRLTGALPVLTLLQLRERVLPIEFVHILSFFKDADFDIESLNSLYEEGVEGGQVIVFGDKRESTFRAEHLKPGIYRWHNGRALYLGRQHLLPEGEREFAILEGPYMGIGPGMDGWDNFLRILRIIFKTKLTNDNGRLDAWVKDVITWVREVIFGRAFPEIPIDNNDPALFKCGSRGDKG